MSSSAPAAGIFDRTASTRSVELTAVSKEFTLGRKRDSFRALDGFDMAVDQGEFVAILGPSGCGKSTVLRMIAGLETPTSGTVRVEGGPPSALIEQHRLGVAFQDSALLPWASAWENVALPFRLAGRPVPAERVRRLLETVGLTGFDKARPRQLSGGMKQRISIARSMALDPDVLLLDEPFGALDAVTRRRLNLELGGVWAAQRTTTVLVTHDVPEAVLLADRVVVMTGRPGSCAHIETVDKARPRGEEFTRTPEFHRTVDRLTSMLDNSETR
ncbi:ABC transporter ATP-binding protein [Actinocrispum wychmicini]|uniref:NitT/TauT family transport system ATP-binding protein n=1 Tax=Actinocrispum wychmicini TaxID=1213861 RepID=A0A4R2JKA4_9PSEU|nr:ABC transporter ATP-binding protein [Actinocrispum wychmicini]TCO59584.1 NitT/TauT family transport system ATP-binding protein [Actinocrispum wychmicini]